MFPHPVASFCAHSRPPCGQIKQQFKIIIIHQQKVEQVKETNQAELLRLQSLLVPLEKKAQSLAADLKENNAANSFLKKAFNLIKETKQDIKDLEYTPVKISDAKYLDLTIGKKIQTIHNGKMEAGRHLFNWNSNLNPSGIYFSVLKTNNSVKTKKLMLIK